MNKLMQTYLSRMNGYAARVFLLLLPALLFLPQFAAAQDDVGLSNTVSDARDLVDQLIPLVASLTLLAFFWGLAKYIFNAGNEEAQAQGKRVMVGGIVALFLIATIGGIIEFLASAFGFDTGANISPPGISGNIGEELDSANIVYNGRDGIG